MHLLLNRTEIELAFLLPLHIAFYVFSVFFTQQNVFWKKPLNLCGCLVFKYSNMVLRADVILFVWERHAVEGMPGWDFFFSLMLISWFSFVREPLTTGCSCAFLLATTSCLICLLWKSGQLESWFCSFDLNLSAFLAPDWERRAEVFFCVQTPSKLLHILYTTTSMERADRWHADMPSRLATPDRCSANYT